MREESQRVRKYELMTIFSPEISDEELQTVVDRVTSLISAHGGAVSLINRESPWGRRRLAYPIRHQGHDVRDGYYVLYYADLASQHVAEFERELRLMDSLMRYLLTQQVAEPMLPQSQLEAAQQQEEGAETSGEVDTATGAAPEEPASQTQISETTEPEEAAPEEDQEAATLAEAPANADEGSAASMEEPAPVESHEIASEATGEAETVGEQMPDAAADPDAPAEDSAPVESESQSEQDSSLEDQRNTPEHQREE